MDSLLVPSVVFYDSVGATKAPPEHLDISEMATATPERPKTIPELIDFYSELYGADPNLVHAIARSESGEKNIGNKLSTAFGPFQVLKGTWKKWECEGDRFNSEDSTKCAIQHIANGELYHWNESVKYWFKAYVKSELMKSAASFQ